MSHLSTERTHSGDQTDAVQAQQDRAPLISRLIDPSNVVFSLVFCQQTRRDFDIRQAN